MLLFKFIATFFSFLMLLLNFYIEHDTFDFFEPELSYNVPEVKVAGFALVAAMSLFVSLLHNAEAPDGELLLDRIIQAIGAIAAGAAAWFALEQAMNGKQLVYFALMGVYVGLIAFGILMVGTITAIRSLWKNLISSLKNLIPRWRDKEMSNKIRLDWLRNYTMRLMHHRNHQNEPRTWCWFCKRK